MTDPAERLLKDEENAEEPKERLEREHTELLNEL